MRLEKMNYAGGDGAAGPVGSPSTGFGQGVNTTVQDIGIGLSNYGQLGIAPGAMVAGVVGSNMMGQQADAMADAAQAAQAANALSDMGIGTFSDTHGNIGTFSTPSTIAAADEATFGADAVSGLAAMNESVAAQNEAQTSPAAVAASVADAVASADADADAAAAAADAGGVGDAGTAGGDGGGSGDSGGGGDGGGGDSGAASGDSGGATSGDGLYRGGPVMRYAQGGMPALARKVQNEGRRDDTMLVHMTPAEVGGLQSLARMHGGSLSINPNTGLPEAGFLRSILPMVAGAALAPLTAGTSLAFLGASPLAAGLTIGGITGLATGSLSKGLMAGLGAFGGAGLGGALSAAGATAPGVVGTQAGLASAGDVAAANMLGVSGAAAGPGSQAAMLAQQNAALGLTPAQSLANIGSSAGYAAGANIPSVAGQTAGLMGQGVSALGTEPGRQAFMSSIGGPMGLAKTAGAAAAPALTGAFNEPYDAGGKGQAYIRPFQYDARPQMSEPGFAYRTGARGESTAEQRYFDPVFTPVGVYKAGTEPAYRSYAGGGITALKKGGNLPPRYLEDAADRTGKSDGMSDGIRARIGGMQEARLADGEFVIPADVVSHLGNGSSNAGAKKLHAMMDRIRKARTGKQRQAPEVKTDRFMPA